MNDFADLHGIKITTVSKLRYSIFFDAVVFHMLFRVSRLLIIFFYGLLIRFFQKIKKSCNLSLIGQN